jgi:Mycothiol maleylpyruvate isomerase N-terminal domain
MPMTTSMQATTTLPGPVAETRLSHVETLAALQGAAIRSAKMWRRVADFDAPVPGLDWTAGETAAHMIGDLRDYTEALTRYARGYVTHANRPTEPPSQLSAQVNARHLNEIPERNLHRLATQLEEAAANYVAVAQQADLGTPILTPNGLMIDPSTMTGLLLGEQLIHSMDIARATHRMWSIGAEDALLVIPAVLTVAPSYLRPSRAHQRVSFELRMRGGARYRLAVENGSATVDAAGLRADCTITADPVTFLLVGFGRIPRLAPVLRGKLRPGGRKPWRAMRFGTLLSSP